MTPNQDHPVPGKTGRRSAEVRSRDDDVTTIYDAVVVQLRDRGWVKGTPRRGDALCLVAAIDKAVGADAAAVGVSSAAKMARAGRVGSHLRDLIGERNLAAWSDESSRTLEDVVELLEEAAIAFPED